MTSYPMTSFEALGLSEGTLKVLQHKGFEEPTPIQSVTIPAILTGLKDIVGQAQTGTGKTAAFGLPIMELLPEKSPKVQVLVLTPTRELAIQVAEEMNSLKGKKKLSIVPIYGGQSIELQLRSLLKGVDIVVGTPGRILDHLERKTLKLENISFLVLDEADEMLNMGFIDDVVEIMKHTRPEKRTMLFSATMPREILQIAKKYMHDYEFLQMTKGELTISQTDQIYFEVAPSDRFEALCRIIDMEEEFYGLVFCRTKIDVDTVATHLIERGYDADALHGDMSQNQREKTLGRFRSKRITILVATDVAARGIDIQNMTHVINYSLPQDSDAYVHRIGRTGRAGKEGNAITFITSEEYRKLQYIMRAAKTDIRKAKLPGVKDVIKTKKQRIKAELEEIVAAKPRADYLEMAADLLLRSDPEEMLAALLQSTYHEELDANNYTEIESVVVDKKGKTRLFVTQGKADGLTPRKLIQYIHEKCEITDEKIKNIQIYETFSFMTLPFHEAEALLSSFKNSKKGSGPFIKKAKPERPR